MMPPRASQRLPLGSVNRARRGATLVELVATITVLAALGAVGSNLILTASDGYLASRTASQLQVEASMAMDRMVRELRNIPRNPTAPPGSPPGGAAPAIDDISTDSIQWNGNNRLRALGETLVISIDGSPEHVLISDVQSFELRAFDELNNPIALPAAGSAVDDIRRIECSLTLSRRGVSQHVRTKVFLRCAMQFE